MKANRKFIEQKEAGCSATIGVILMVAITVAIAAVVYYYVTTMLDSVEDIILCGKIKYIPVENDWDNYGILHMRDDSYYCIYHISDRDYSMLKFAYNNNCTFSAIIEYYWDNDQKIAENSVNLLDCGCNND